MWFDGWPSAPQLKLMHRFSCTTSQMTLLFSNVLLRPQVLMKSNIANGLQAVHSCSLSPSPSLAWPKLNGLKTIQIILFLELWIADASLHLERSWGKVSD